METSNNKNILRNPIAKNIFSAVLIAIFGFLLLNLVFMLEYLFQTIFQALAYKLIGIFRPVDLVKDLRWLAPLIHGLFTIIIGIISLFILRSKLDTFYKATFLIVPLALIFATIGIALYRWPVAAISSGVLVYIGVIYFLFKTKQAWLYYSAVSLIAIVMLIVGLTGVEI